VVAFLVPWIFAVTNDNSAKTIIDVAPEDGGDFGLTHGGRNCEADNSPNRDHLTWVAVEMRDERVEFGLGRPAVSFSALANEPETSQSDTRQFDRLFRDGDAMNRCCMGHDGVDIRKLRRHSDGTGALPRTAAPVVNEHVATDPIERYGAELASEQLKRVSF